MTKLELKELSDIRDGVVPGGMAAENRRVVLKGKGLAYRDDARPWKWHLTDQGKLATK